MIEAQVRVHLKRAVLLADLIDARNPGFDVSGRIPIAFLELVFFGIKVLLTTWQSLILTQLVSAVDSVERRKRRSQQDPDHECRAAALLKHVRQDVGRVRPKIRPKIFTHLSLRKFSEIVYQLLL